MIKKILAAFLAIVFVFSLCACGNDKAGVSSNVTNGETSSMAQSEQSSSEESSSKKVSSQETSSVKTESEAASSEKTSSSKRPSVDRTSSQTESESVKVTLSYKNTAKVGIYHFNPSWTTNLGKDDDSRYKEMEEVLKAGYFSTIIVGRAHLEEERLWDMCKKYDITVWVSMYSYFQSSKKTIDEYLAPYEKTLAKVKEDPEKWDRFSGFHFEESIWRGQSNDDFLTQSRECYQRFGKRTFVVFATGEFTGVEGNEHLLDTSAEKMQKVLPSSMKYITDVSFDSYAVDVRPDAPNGTVIQRMQKELPGVVDGKTYYSELTKLMLRITGHKANVWFFPTVYTCGLWGGLDGLERANEEYCMAHLRFFTELLGEQEYQGGLFLYTYSQFSNKNELGFQSTMVLRDENNEHMFRKDEPKWVRYSALLKQTTEKLRATEAKIIETL